ncbi:MAG: hypothetical protein E7626_04980 [Ruminococcaceae bacterium]|nr:hypothetical protein [Oscillospiraceae bacterium]
MKKLTLRTLSLLLALVMALSFALVGCTDDTDDEDEDDGGKKATNINLTEENAEKILLAAFEKLENAKYFECTSTLYHADDDGYENNVEASVIAQKDGDVYKAVVESKEKLDENSDATDGDDDEAGYVDYVYLSGNTEFNTASTALAGKEFCIYEDPIDVKSIINKVSEDLFMLPIETAIKNFCANEITVEKNGNVYTATVEITSYKQVCEIFVTEDFDATNDGYIDSCKGKASFSVSKKGDLAGISMDFEFDAEGTKFISKVDAKISEINADKTVSEPEWYTNRSYASGDTLSEVRDGVRFEYTVDRSETLAFNGAFYHDDYYIDTVKYYKLLTELDGIKVTEIDCHGYIDIENLVVPGTGVGFKNGFNDLNCTIFLDGETNITFSPVYFAVKGIYAEGDWEMVDGVPTAKDGAESLVSGSNVNLPDDDYDDDDNWGDNNQGDDNQGDDEWKEPDLFVPGETDESVRFVGKWVTDFDFTEFFNEIMDAQLGEMAVYFNFDDINIAYIVEFFADGTYRTQVDEASIEELMVGLENIMRAGLTDYINSMASQAGYPSGDALCRAEFGMSLEEYVNESVKELDFSSAFPIDDTKTSGEYVAYDGKLYLAEDGNDFSVDNYTPYEFINDYTFEMRLPDNFDEGNIDEDTAALYDMIVGMFPLVFGYVS